MPNNTKEEVRERILTLLRNQEEEERLNKSLLIKDKLFQLPEFQKCKTILFYASFDGEVDTFEMMSQAQKLGKKIGLPKIVRGKKEITPTLVAHLEEDLEQGPYGIKQPKDTHSRLTLEKIDMVIVPGVAFDRNNYRLGRGGGYYDFFLKNISSDIPTVGLAFDFQVVDQLPHLVDHDIPVSCVLLN